MIFWTLAYSANPKMQALCFGKQSSLNLCIKMASSSYVSWSLFPSLFYLLTLVW